MLIYRMHLHTKLALWCYVIFGHANCRLTIDIRLKKFKLKKRTAKSHCGEQSKRKFARLFTCCHDVTLYHRY